MLGGSFDPVHAAHLAMARAALRTLKLDCVLLVPAKASPFKSTRPTAGRHRMAMLELALGKIPRIGVTNLDLTRRAPSYTVETLRALKRYFSPGTEFYLLMGSDSASEFHKWFKYKEINKLSTVAVFARPGSKVPRGMLRIPMSPMTVSATMLRDALRSGRTPPAGGIPTVLAYARRFQLYSK